jgi:hypothetical protein
VIARCAPISAASAIALRYGTIPRSPFTSMTSAFSSVVSISSSAAVRSFLSPMPYTVR